MHAIRRNLDINIILFNNRIYGLTKGQYSPTSPLGKKTKSSPYGSIDNPLHPLSIAVGCEGTFVARTIDTNIKHLGETLKRAALHRGTAFVEVYQNCNVFNDGAFAAVRDKQHGAQRNQIRLEHGKPIRFGEQGENGVVQKPDGSLEIVDVEAIGEDALLVHDAHRENPALAFSLAQLAHQPTGPTPIGVFRDVRRPVYGEAMERQLEMAADKLGRGDLGKLLHSGDTWTVE
jgi:2-oxoglutarate ferredoxin oxidoreductase subunit beta